MVKLGEVVSLTSTSKEQALGQALLITFKVKVKFVLQPPAAMTVTVRALVAPDKEPLPESDQE